MAYEPTQWRSGDTITSERLNKMEQGIAGSGEFYALHTTRTETTDENDIINITYSSVELREDGLPMWLIVDDGRSVERLCGYNNEYFDYDGGEGVLTVNRSTGEVTEKSASSGGKE